MDWSFDQMFTGIICEDYGLEKGGKVSHSQAKRIEEEAFSNLVNFDFYTYIFVDGVAQTIKYKKFKVKLLGDKIVYSFQVPLKLARQIELYHSVCLLRSDYLYRLAFGRRPFGDGARRLLLHDELWGV